MATGIVTSPEVFTETTLKELTNGSLSESQAIFEQGREAVVFALLERAKQVAMPTALRGHVFGSHAHKY